MPKITYLSLGWEIQSWTIAAMVALGSVDIQPRGRAGIQGDRVTLLETKPALTAKLAKTKLIARHHGYIITLAETAI